MVSSTLTNVRCLSNWIVQCGINSTCRQEHQSALVLVHVQLRRLSRQPSTANTEHQQALPGIELLVLYAHNVFVLYTCMLHLNYYYMYMYMYVHAGMSLVAFVVTVLLFHAGCP